MSEPPRLRASALRLVAFAVRLRSLSPSAPLGATPTATAHTRSSAPTASCSALIWWANSETSPACRRTPPAPRLWGSLPRLLHHPHGTPPHRLNTKKGRRQRLPSGCQNVRQSSRPARSSASNYPTPWPHPSPEDRRTGQTECDRTRPARRHHRVEYSGFRSGSGHRPG